MKRRPAETAGAGAGITGLVAALATSNWLAAAVAVAGFIPGAVTWLVAHGGISGAMRSLWRGKS